MKKLFFLGRADALSQSLLHHFEARAYSCRQFRYGELDWTDIAKLQRQLGREQPDVLIVYPSWQGRGAFLETSAADWETALEQNVEATTLILQAALKMFRDSGQKGRIIVLSHVSALQPFRGLSVMGTTLSAVTVLVKMLALELAPDVTVNSVAVGPLAAGLKLPDEAVARLVRDTPLGEGFEAVAEVCLFLASEAARHLTGQTLPVEGGFLLTRGDGVSPYA